MKQKVSLVLSGGSARGMAHIGVIEELEKQGFEITSVAGTSMGAVVGAAYVSGKLEPFKNWLFSLDKMKVFNLVDFSFSTQGLIKGDKVLNTMKAFFSDECIENFKIPYAAVAADIINKKEVVFTRGSVYNAIRASIAIPTVLTPVQTENGLLVDGGVINNIPTNHVQRREGDILVVVNVNADIAVFRPVISKNEDEARQSVYQKKIKDFYNHLGRKDQTNHNEKLGYFDVINKTLALMAYHNAQISLEQHKPDILIEVSRDACNAYDFYKAEEMVEIGKHAAIMGTEKFKAKTKG